MVGGYTVVLLGFSGSGNNGAFVGGLRIGSVLVVLPELLFFWADRGRLRVKGDLVSAAMVAWACRSFLRRCLGSRVRSFACQRRLAMESPRSFPLVGMVLRSSPANGRCELSMGAIFLYSCVCSLFRLHLFLLCNGLC